MDQTEQLSPSQTSVSKAMKLSSVEARRRALDSFVPPSEFLPPPPDNGGIGRGKNAWKNKKRRQKSNKLRGRGFEKEALAADYQAKKAHEIADKKKVVPFKGTKKEREKSRNFSRDSKKVTYDTQSLEVPNNPAGRLLTWFVNNCQAGHEVFDEDVTGIPASEFALFGLGSVLSSEHLVVFERLFHVFKMVRGMISIPDPVVRQSAIVSCIINEVTHFTGKSTIQTIASYLMGIDFPHDAHSSGVDFGKFFSTAKGSWRDLCNSPMAGVLFKIMSLVISVGFCSVSDLTFSVAGLEIFNKDLCPKCSTLSDFVDGSLSILETLVTCGYKCWTEGSLMPLFGSTEVKTSEQVLNDLILMVSSYSLGNLELEYAIDDKQLEDQLEDARVDLSRQILSTRNLAEKRILNSVMSKLNDLYIQFKKYRTSGRTRRKPFGVAIVGPPGVGKSVIMEQLIQIGMNSIGEEYDKDKHFLRFNQDDKYQSLADNRKKVVVMDDVGNTKDPEINPAGPIIQMMNNVAWPIAKADLEGKTGIELSPVLAIVTSNRSDLGSHEYSHEPGSILRRFEMFVEIFPKREFCIPGTTQLDADLVNQNYGHDSFYKDLYTFDVYSMGVGKKHGNARAESIRRNILTRASYQDFLLYYAGAFSKHYEAQGKLLEQINNSRHEALCGVCSMPRHFCVCTEFDAQVGFGVPEKVSEAMSLLHNCDTHWFGSLVQRLSSPPGVRLVQPLTDRILENAYVVKAQINFALFIMKYIQHFVFILSVFSCMGLVFTPWFFIFPLVVAWSLAFYYKLMIKWAENKIVDYNVTPMVWKTWFIREFVPYCVMGGLVVKFIPWLRLVRYARKLYNESDVFDTNGSLDPKDDEELRKRDAEPNVWARPAVRPLPPNDRAKCTSVAQLQTMCEKALVSVRGRKDDATVEVNGIYLGSNVCLVPWHFVKCISFNQPVRFAKYGWDANGSVFECLLSRNRCVQIENTDLCLVWTPNSGNKKDLTLYLPEEYLGGTQYSVFVCKDNATCMPIKDKCVLQASRVTHVEMTFSGYTTSYSSETRKGMCMGVHVTNSKQPEIFAFHLGGKGKLGCCGRIKRSDWDKAFKELCSRPGVLPGGSEGIFRNEVDGDPIVFTPHTDKKSAVNFVTEQNFNVFGSLKVRIKPHTNVGDTLIVDSVEQHLGITNIWGPPKFRDKTVWPYSENLQKCVDGSRGVPPLALEWAVGDYTSGIINHLKGLPGLVKSTKPWTVIEAISGVPGIRFCDPMAMKTSAGFRLKGKKHSHVEDVFDEFGRYSHRVPNEALQREIDHITECYLLGERSDSIFNSLLKDEPTDVSSKKVRVFQAGPMGHYVVAKQYVGPVVRLLRMISLVSETAVGVDPTGPDWEKLTGYAFGQDRSRVVAGDYSGYDKRLGADVLSAAWKVYYDVAAYCGYDDDSLEILRNGSSDTIYSYQNYDGTLLGMIGSEPSGEPFTVDVDSCAGSLLIRCAYFTFCKESNLELVPFRDVVSWIQNGDDHIGSVSKSLEGFDQLYFQSWLAKFGMKYTGTDKSDTLLPYSHADSVEFLKRVSTSVDGLPFQVGKLNQTSIFKSLCSCIHSTEITREVHAAQVIEGALREGMFHGRNFYEGLQEGLIRVALDHDIYNLCPTIGAPFSAAIWQHRMKHSSPDESKLVAPAVTIDGSEAKQGVSYMDDHDDFGNPSTERIGGFETQARCVFTQGSPPKKKGSTWSRLSGLIMYVLLFTLATKDSTMHGGTVDKQDPTQEKESEVMKETAVVIEPLGSTQNENVYYHEEDTSFIAKRDDERSVAHLTGTMDAIMLGTFVQRPVRIQTLSWGVGAGVEVNFNPWQNYFANPAVDDKIKNFYRIQCGMKVKFQIVGNQFNFGRLLVAYQPFVTVNGQNLNQVYPWPGVAAPFTPDNADLCLLSQYPHLYLDPVNNAGGELEIPFLWYRNYFEVPTRDWLTAGSIIITTLSPLEAANGSTDPVTIQVIAQPTNFSMDVPTEFEPQCNIVFDTQSNTIMAASQFDPGHPLSSGLGVVSAGLGDLATAKGKKKNKKARKFSKGMKTAALGAKMAGNMASKFGFTRQPNAMGCNPYVPRFLNTFAMTEGTSEGVPLTCYLDSQVTVSPERFGVGNTDETTITSVACKEAYFNKFTWSTSDAPGSNLFGCEVSPAIWTTNTTSGMVAMTPACFAVQPFEFWSGTIIFRFQVVSSSFHKGILLIKYDPDAQATGTDLNLQTLASIDISKDRDITVEVGMSQIVPWLYHRSVVAPSNPTTNAGGFLPLYSTVGPFLNNSIPTIPQIVGDNVLNWRERLVLNGVISVQVFNTLVVPANSTSSSIEVLCHMSAGSDFKVGSPTDLYIRDMMFNPPPPPPVSAAAPQVSVAETVSTPRDRRQPTFDTNSDIIYDVQMNASNDPVSPTDGAPEALTIAHHFGASLPEGMETCDQYMGECIESLRVLLHRKQYHSAITTGVANDLTYFCNTISDFPNYPGTAVPNSLSSSNTTNYQVNMTVLCYVTAAYALRSGGVSNTYNVDNIGNQLLTPGTFTVSRAEKGVPASNTSFTVNPANPNQFVYRGTPNAGRSANASGMHVTPRLLNSVLDVNTPYYDNLNGYPAQMTALDEGNVFTRCHRVEGYDNNALLLIERYVAAGPDFSLGMFLSAPPVYSRQF